jgi:TonB family protein
VYTAEDPGVTPAVAIKQDFPRLPSSVASLARDRGVIEVVIDEQGRVVHAQIRTSVHPVYDSLLMLAVRDWRYQPATLAAHPIKYRKMIQIEISK